MSVDSRDVKKIAALAKLSLSERQAEEMLDSLNQVLALLDDIRNADVSGVDDMPYVQGHGQSLRCRPSTPQPGLDKADVFANAPHSEKDHFIVPKVIE